MGNNRSAISDKRRQTNMQILLFLLPAVAFAAHPAPHHGYGHPKLYCRDTNTSVYAEVCVPQFRPEITPETLAVKIVVPDQFCYESVITTCEETSTINKHTLCTSTYEGVEAKFAAEDALAAHVTQVTYEDKSETMRVTSCKASGYGHGGYGAGEHQYCREEYQTQAYKVPLVTEPLAITVDLTNAEPVKTCVTKVIEIDEVVCEDVKSQRCFNVARLVDSTNTIVQSEVVLGEPKCDAVTLTLPTKACKKTHY